MCGCREKILEYRDESQRLDQCSRLFDSSVSNNGFELDASSIVQVHIVILTLMYSTYEFRTKSIALYRDFVSMIGMQRFSEDIWCF